MGVHRWRRREGYLPVRKVLSSVALQREQSYHCVKCMRTLVVHVYLTPVLGSVSFIRAFPADVPVANLREERQSFVSQ